MSSTLTNDWVNYWDQLPPGRLLLSPESDEYIRKLTANFPIGPNTRILDFGCGYGLIAEILARLGADVTIWDLSPSMRQHAMTRLAHLPNVHEWNPDGEAPLFDLILVNSVLQYMSPAERNDRLIQWHGVLSQGGKIVLSDLIPHHHSTVADLSALIWFGLRRGYLLRALKGIWKERPRYQRTVSRTPLQHVDRDELKAEAERLGYSIRFLPRNLTHFAGRMTAVLEVAHP